MNALTRLLTLPKRKWRSRGFGIHSPFAFSFITKVIGEKGEYYAYPELRKISGRRYDEMSLLFRCVCHFAPQTLAAVGDDGIIMRTVQLADSRIRPASPLSASMTAVENVDSLAEKINSEVVIIFNLDNKVNSLLWEKLKSEMSRGMDFTDGKTGIICRFSHLPRQSFKLSF